MPRNAILDESKTEYWPVAFNGIDKVRVQPTVAEVLDDARPATLGKGDQLIHGALKTVLIEAIMAGKFRAVYDTLGKILGIESAKPHNREVPHDGEVGQRKPLARSPAR